MLRRWVELTAVRLANRYVEGRIAHMANSKRKGAAAGKRRITMALYDRMCERVAGTPRMGAVHGYSPGYVAAQLGVSRQRVHALMDAGKLTAYYVEDDTSGALRAIIITDDSLQALKAEREATAA